MYLKSEILIKIIEISLLFLMLITEMFVRKKFLKMGILGGLVLIIIIVFIWDRGISYLITVPFIVMIFFIMYILLSLDRTYLFFISLMIFLAALVLWIFGLWTFAEELAALGFMGVIVVIIKSFI